MRDQDRQQRRRRSLWEVLESNRATVSFLLGFAILVFEAAKTIAHYEVDSELIVAATGLMTIPIFKPSPKEEGR